MAEEKEKFTPIAGLHPTGTMTVQEAFPNVETVTVVVPKQIILTIDADVHNKKGHHMQVRLNPGTQEIPAFLARPEMHWWLKAHGVKCYEIARKDNEEKLTRAPQNPVPVVQSAESAKPGGDKRRRVS